MDMALDTIRCAHAGMIMIMIMARDLENGVLLQLLLNNGDKCDVCFFLFNTEYNFFLA